MNWVRLCRLPEVHIHTPRGLSNRPVAVFESWNYTLAQIGIGASEAMAFSNYFCRLLSALGLNVPIDNNNYSLIDYFAGNVPTGRIPLEDTPGYSTVHNSSTFISYRGIEMNGKTQNFFMFFFWACSLVWFATVLAKADFSSVTELVAGVGIPAEVNAFAQAVLLVLWCFFGYETIVGMGSEVKFPQITLPRALLISPFCVLAVNLLFSGSCVHLLRRNTFLTSTHQRSLCRCDAVCGNRRPASCNPLSGHHSRRRLLDNESLYCRSCQIYIHHVGRWKLP